jgi:hypothetical protein
MLILILVVLASIVVGLVLYWALGRRGEPGE